MTRDPWVRCDRSMTSIVKRPRIAESLAHIHYRLGFVPSESTIFASVTRSGEPGDIVIRIDTADLGGSASVLPLVGYLARHGVTSVALVMYGSAEGAAGDDELPAGLQPLESEVVNSAAEALEGAGIRWEAWRVHAGSYWTLDPTPPYAPGSPRSLDDLQSTSAAARLVSRGLTVAPSRQAAVALPEAAPGVARAVARAFGRERRARERARARGELAAWAQEAAGTWLRLIDPGTGDGAAEPAPVQTGLVLAALEHIPLRDAIIATMVTPEIDSEMMDIAALSDPADPRVMRVMGDVLDGGELVPDEERVAACRQVLESAATAAARKRRAPVLAVLALLEWFCGSGIRATDRVRGSLRANSRYSLAVLMCEVLESGMVPRWAAEL